MYCLTLCAANWLEQELIDKDIEGWHNPESEVRLPPYASIGLKSAR